MQAVAHCRGIGVDRIQFMLLNANCNAVVAENWQAIQYKRFSDIRVGDFGYYGSTYINIMMDFNMT